MKKKELKMTDTLIQTLEEKVMLLLTELEDLRFEVQQLKQENANFKAEKNNYAQKLQGLIALLDSVDVPVTTTVSIAAPSHELEAALN